jgi:hypothetical protein
MAKIEFDSYDDEAFPEQEERSFEPLPPKQWYRFVIDQSEYGPNSAGTGMKLALTLNVSEGPHEGRMLWENLNLEHKNAQAVQISRRLYREIVTAVASWPPPDDFEDSDLIGKELEGYVTTERGKNGYEDKSRIRRARKMTDGELKQPKENTTKAKAGTATGRKSAPAKAAPWKVQKSEEAEAPE